jgi:hypothetical protein
VRDELGPEGGADVLPVLAQLSHHRGHARAAVGVQVGVDLIEQVERRGVALLDRKDCEQMKEVSGRMNQITCERADLLIANATNAFCPPDNCWILSPSFVFELNDTLIATPV